MRVVAKEQQIVCKSASVDLVKWKWRTKVNMQKCLNKFCKCFELKEDKLLFIQQKHEHRVCLQSPLCFQKFRVEIHGAAAVIATSISSKLLISQCWQHITVHTSGKYLEHTWQIERCGYSGMIPLKLVTLFAAAGLIIHEAIWLRESGLCHHPSCEQTDWGTWWLTFPGRVRIICPREQGQLSSKCHGVGCPDNGLNAGLLSPVSAGIGLPFEEVHSSASMPLWGASLGGPVNFQPSVIWVL